MEMSSFWGPDLLCRSMPVSHCEESILGLWRKKRRIYISTLEDFNLGISLDNKGHILGWRFWGLAEKVLREETLYIVGGRLSQAVHSQAACHLTVSMAWRKLCMRFEGTGFLLMGDQLCYPAFPKNSSTGRIHSPVMCM